MVFIICALLSAPAAATSFFTNQAAFLAAGGATLNFEGFNDARALAALQQYDGFTLAEQAGAGNSIQSSRNNNVLPAGLVEGAGYVFYDDNGNSRAVFNFAGTINAFGIFVTSNFDGVPDAQGDMAITGSFGSDTLGLIINQPRFWGVIADAPFSSVTFTMPLEPVVAFDSLRHGTIAPPSAPPAVPEPQSWALLLVGFALVGFARRRRRAVG
ncbi:MAG: PEPxxWA-CTERM sorting domain-containing protein [Sandarakinorhabdus sp.]